MKDVHLCVPIGAKVGIGPTFDIEAEIIGVCVYAKGKTDYQCVWWSGRDRKVEWLGTNEIQPSKKQDLIMQIGFSSAE